MRWLRFTVIMIPVALGRIIFVTAQDAPAFRFEQVMIPMRDGVRLQTVILTPAGATGPLPILFRRTPYGVPSTGNIPIAGSLKEFMRDISRKAQERGLTRRILESIFREP